VTLRWSRALLGDASGAHLAHLFAQSFSTTSDATLSRSNAEDFRPEADAPEGDATASDTTASDTTASDTTASDAGAPGVRRQPCRPGGLYGRDAPHSDPTPGGARSAGENHKRPS
jgi:hypothetical protein